MNKFRLETLLVLLLTVMSLSAQKRVKQSVPVVTQDWKEAFADAKLTQASQTQTSNILAQEQVKTKQPAKTISIDVSGMEQIILSLDSKLDKSQEDYAAWFAARLVDKNGNITYLGDNPDLMKALTGSLVFNKRMNDGSVLTVDNKRFESSVMNDLKGQILVILDKKYAKFEAEAGIHSVSNLGEATYCIEKAAGKEMTDKILSRYGKEMSNFMIYASASLPQMLISTECKAEKALAHEIVGRLQKQTYFLEKLKALEVQASPKTKIIGYLAVIDEAILVYQLQENLSWLNMNALQKAFDDMRKNKNFDLATTQNRLIELKTLVSKGFDGIYTNDPTAIESGRKALSLKRDILLSNPLLDIDRLIVGRYKAGEKARSMNPSGLGTQANNWSNQTSANQLGFDAEIAELSNLRGEIHSRTIFKPEHSASVPDLHLHWNADRILFSMPEKGEHHWQVYEVGVDGKNLKQLTHGSSEDLDYFDACYLPNGKLIVNSNVGGQGVPCVSGSDQVGNLCLYDPKNNDMRRLTFDQDANWGPVVMHNGRVMYIRWEYTDLTHYFSRIVMHMNPDGTEQRSLYGSGSVFPTSIYDVVPLPDHSTRFIGIISGHHGTVRSGRLMIFDPAISRKEEKGMVQELPFRNRKIIPIVKDEMVDGVWPQFLKPQPLNNDYFIITAKLSPEGLWGLYLIDIYDNLTLIAEYEGEGLIYGIPLKKTTTPPVIPDKVDMKQKEATVFIQDIYEGEGLPGIKRGDVKELRVFAYEYAYLKTPSDNVAQGIQSGWDIKRLLGTVPVEPDGSVIFKIPANTPISLQPLDKDGAAIQWMRSWLTGMPGETVSCVGCHEDQNQIPMPKRVAASTKVPSLVQAPEGGVRSITFALEIQPILDRNCIACHNDQAKRNLTGGRKDDRGFDKSYLQIHPYIHRQGPEAGMKVLYPYEYHPSNSALVRMLKNGHHGVKLTDKEWRTLYMWIDLNAPDKGSFEAIKIGNTDQKARRIALNKKYANGIYADWEQELKDYTAYSAKQPKPETVKPEEKAPAFKEVKQTGFPFDAQAYIQKTLGNSPKTKIVEIAPGVKLTFVRIPAGKFVMGQNKKDSDYAPAFKAEVKKDFWMSTTEITNQQMRVFLSNHDSRYIDQQWKDHVTEGYEGNRPEQVASRVSYHQAIEFCQKASQKTGLKFALPTETQWEWACRGGSDQSFWYGDLKTDFGKKENMADKQTLKLAVVGVNPQPMAENHPWYSYFTWLPKNEKIDDGNVLIAPPASYQANPFGLYDMHGNIAEWTSSDYLPYPLKANTKVTSDQKVVRGGSWKEHPKHSTAAYRKAYLPVQRPYNVGFRVIMED